MPIDAAPAEMLIRDAPLAYVASLDARTESLIEGVVLHCTETPDLATARTLGEHLLYASGTGNSGHYYVDLDGSVWSYVPVTRVAHHVRGHNGNTIGIELVNRGRWPRWHDSDHQGMHEPYPDAQINALIRLLQKLERELPQLRWIAGHEDLDTERVPARDTPDVLITRKLDPGPKFPWERVLAASGLQRISESRRD